MMMIPASGCKRASSQWVVWWLVGCRYPTLIIQENGDADSSWDLVHHTDDHSVRLVLVTRRRKGYHDDDDDIGRFWQVIVDSSIESVVFVE
jgi:hypothetical protein